jgi:signal transduction histidine kinase
MTSVIGFADLIAQDDLPLEKRRAYVEKIQRNGRHLLAVIDDILDLSKIEAGHMIITRDRFPLLLEMTQALDLLREQAERKNLSLAFIHDGLVNVEMVSDQVRFRQILLNLVSNAVKFTDAGGITVTLTVHADGLEQRIDLKVIDTGLGIDTAIQGKLFQPFSQATLTVKRPRAGTGLGLALARNIAHVLGGDAFLVESELGKGSTFGVVLPLVAPEWPNHQAQRRATALLRSGFLSE